MDRPEFLRWAGIELSTRHPGCAIDEGDSHRVVRCARNMYLGVDALLDGEMRVHVFTDKDHLMLTTAAPVVGLPPPGMEYKVQRGVDSPGRLYARLTWRHRGSTYATEKFQAIAALDWLQVLVLPNLLP
ncbi:hypothetical protein [Archangium sp. Cb G35]|uniref:hypothetical protein n=1 Tax=Archangium sp. Cb G35 TaxID=1920190 RepID=UPI000ACB71FC|nr:hypothetical protein [Archangium sp. Cb G35]